MRKKHSSQTNSYSKSKHIDRYWEFIGIVPQKNLFVRAASLEVPGGQTLRPKCSSLGGFEAPPTKTSYTTPNYMFR